MAKVVWFDIPVTDMDRAIGFYRTLTGQELTRLPVGEGQETALFQTEEGGSAGCLWAAPEDEPSHYGSRVYFDAGPRLEDWLSRVEPAGGRVLVGRTPIGDLGYYAYIEDSEGNRVGLNAPA
ncbi:VOC family protein [Actinomycetes bacterium KLBMP 9759]